MNVDFSLPDPKPEAYSPSSLEQAIESAIFSCKNLKGEERPIAWRKDVQSCTLHPISYYVLDRNLSHASIGVPTNIQEDLSQPQWREVVLDKMNARKKNQT